MCDHHHIIFFLLVFSDEFRSKVACENDVIQLVCNPYSRVAIYSSSYGRTEHDSLQCAQPQGTREDSKCMQKLQYMQIVQKIMFNNFMSTACLASYATETVMQICHGRRRCSLSADSSTFGKPCKADTKVYLKVVYTCGMYFRLVFISFIYIYMVIYDDI